MKTSPELAGVLKDLIQSHYYSEDFELLSAVRAFYQGLSLPERDELRAIVVQRLLAEGSMVDILLCSVVPVPPAGPVLARKLDQESVPSQLTRALITAVQEYPGDEAYRAVERFLDSDQEGEALAALARLDFSRALPRVALALERPHLLGPVLHVLHARAKVVGVPALGVELRAESQRQPPTFRTGLLRALTCKSASFNPFATEALDRLQRMLA